MQIYYSNTNLLQSSATSMALYSDKNDFKPQIVVGFNMIVVRQISIVKGKSNQEWSLEKKLCPIPPRDQICDRGFNLKKQSHTKSMKTCMPVLTIN